MIHGKTKFLAAGLSFCVLLSAFGAENRQKLLPGHVPAIVRHLTPIGRPPATNLVALAIGLPFRDAAGLDHFLAQVYDPASPMFRKFLTPAELTQRFGPTEQDYAAVGNFARTNGLTISATHGNRLLLDVRGPVSAVEKAFHVTLRTYRHPTEKRDFFAPDTEPTVDASLPIADVSGLESFSRPYPKLHRSAGLTPNSGSAPDGVSYFGSDFRNAYVPGTALDGTGQTVGLVQFEGYFASDITTYASLAGGGRTNIVVQPVLLDEFDGTPNGNDQNGIAEVSLDIEMAMSMAPGLSQIVVFEGNQSPGLFLPNDVLNAMASSNTIKNLSSSWSWSGGPSTTTDNIFKTMAAQGQTYFNASGDSDAFPPGYADNSGNTTTPGNGPYVTDVGGTTLSTAGAGGPYTSETVWNWGYVAADSAYVGSSGGVSLSYPLPVWQQGVNSFLDNGGSRVGRNIPDVALTADGVYVIYDDGNTGAFGGTSCATPLWAGFMALVNQAAAANGQPSVGFINPAVYELANESIYPSLFHDITTGNNTSASSPNAFYAVPGYDLCTGVGTPAGTNLINALVSPDPLVVVSNGGFTAVGMPSGAFSITSETFYLTNASVSPLTWSLINTSAWLSVSANSGTLAAGAGGSVVVSLNAVATNLTLGTYTASLWFSNTTSGVGHSRFFVLQPADPLGILPTNNFTYFGFPGGAISPSNQVITLINGRSNPINWSLNNTSSWLLVSTPGGSLAGGGQTNLTVTVAPAATNLPLGTYTASLLVTDLTSQTVQVISNELLIASSLVQNGGFETGDFTDWTLDGDGPPYDYVDNGSKVYYIAPHSGSYFAALGEAGFLATLAQSLPTVPGQKYLLSVWFNSPDYIPSNPNEFALSWNGTVLYDRVDIPRIGWSNLQYAVAATSGSTVLQIGARDDNYYLGLDDVSVVPGYPPAISTPPTNVVAVAGSNVVFSAAVTGTANFSFRWTQNGANLVNGSGISGATSSTLTLNAVNPASAGNYAVVVTNLFGSVTSSVAALTVVLPVSLTSSTLTNQTVQCGSNNVTFTFTATGTPPLAWQWSLDGTPQAGATNTTFSVTNVHLPSHAISVTISNLYSSATSNTVLTVEDTLPPIITLNGSSVMILELGSAFVDPGATATDLCAGTLGVTPIGTVNTNAVGTNTITYYAGDGNGNLGVARRTVIVRDTTPPAILWSFTNLVLAANSNCVALMPDVTGTNFILATDLSGGVTNSQSPTNASMLSLGTNQVVITAEDASGNAAYSTNTIVVLDETPPLLVAPPLSQTNNAGTTANFSVGATACTPLSFQWYFDVSALPAQTNSTLTLSNVALSASGKYSVVVSAAGGSVTSSVVTLTVYVPSVITSVAPNPDGSFTLGLAGTPGYNYTLEAATNLTSPVWLSIATNTLGTNGVWQFTDPQATNFPQQFYRLMLGP